MKKITLLLAVSLLIFGCSSDDSPNEENQQNSCALPVNLSVQNLTNTTASFNWDVSISSSLYQVEYGTFGFSQGSGITLTVPDTYTSVQNLQPQTQYSFYTRVFCNESQTYSNWAGPFSFVTLDSNPFCEDPTNFTEDVYPDSITHNKIDLYWSSPSSGGSEIQYGVQGFNLGSGTTQIEPDFYDQSASINNLNSETTYDFYVRNVCEDSGFSSWVGPVSITTLNEPSNPNCIDPFNFTSTSSGTNSDGSKYFDFTWDYESSQNSWEIAIVEAGTAFNTSSVTATSFSPVRVSYGGVTSGQAYDFYIRSNCGGTNGFSDWVGPITVTAQ
ncbi:fibronectin type III domain-containing protein [Lacinutrix sp. 5H-3-7-4]|uniref:fibronectin type III domain-containing protein n=1 Tax=Lacinutrix sp. (strain 5H-3-7-4) TaxID=983544 RepID=UPI00020A3919|nr:fibronectin type III domain-containing protein [Lacinutrix sp. 5H-3-7-4]AEH00019.1 Fibronectin type III domain protein [Lacinutrix sp. 5H-3-7-4]